MDNPLFMSYEDFMTTYPTSDKSEALGEGSQGSVVKVIDKPIAVKSGPIEEILVEVDMVCRLKHPNIIQPLNFSLSDKGSFIAYPQGVKLMTYLAENKNQVERCMYELLQVLAFLYNQNVAHCDIKTTNIIVINNSPILIDFGIAKLCYSTADDKLFGEGVAFTDSFISPEPNYGFRSINGDVYSMG